MPELPPPSARPQHVGCGLPLGGFSVERLSAPGSPLSPLEKPGLEEPADSLQGDAFFLSLVCFGSD